MIRRYKRHYCTSLSDKKNCTMIPATKHWSLHTFTVRSLQWNNQNNLRGSTNFSPPFFESHFVLPQSGISSDLDFVPSLYKWIFSFVGTFITGFPFQNSLSVAFDVVEKKKKVKIFLWPSWNEYLFQPLCLSYCVFSSLLLLGSIAQCLIEVYPESKHYFKVSSSDRFFDRTRDFTRISGRCPTSSSNLIETRNGNSDSITLCCCRSSWLRIFFPACSDSPSCCAPLSSDSPV